MSYITLVVYADGGSGDNQSDQHGYFSYKVYFGDPKEPVRHVDKQEIGAGVSNQLAELHAINEVLKWLDGKERTNNKPITVEIRTDSKYAREHFNGNWSTKKSPEPNRAVIEEMHVLENALREKKIFVSVVKTAKNNIVKILGH